MTLGKKIIFYDLCLLLGLMLLAAAALWGLLKIDGSEQVASEEFQELRLMNATNARLQAIIDLLKVKPLDLAATNQQLSAALVDVRQFQALQSNSDADEPLDSHEQRENDAISRALSRLNEVTNNVAAGNSAPAEQSIHMLEQTQDEFDKLADESARLVDSTQRRSSGSVRTSLIAIGTTLLVIMAITLFISIKQYHSIMNPLSSLRVGVRRISSGQFGLRLTIEGDREFMQLADDFNRMASELDGMYRNLEEKVAAKSRELVKSERLASVGFLAAGVAHEINTPLGIISGFAELSLKRLRAAADLAASSDAEKSFQIIRDEAFRCRDITERLLSLAKGGGSRGPVSLGAVAQDVGRMIGLHKHYRDRAVHIDADIDRTIVSGDEAELKQVLLNLMANALNALEEHSGSVHVTVHRANSIVELCVIDDGCGMSSDVLEHLFEPFFTARNGQQRGVGLGLSITHAIVESHGGTITAQSEGPGRGSRFLVRFPAVNSETSTT